MAPEPLRYGLLHDFDAMLDRYYMFRGWDQNGIPTQETLLLPAFSTCSIRPHRPDSPPENWSIEIGRLS